MRWWMWMWRGRPIELYTPDLGSAGRGGGTDGRTSRTTSLLQRMQTRAGSRRPTSSTGRSVALQEEQNTLRQRRLF